MTNVGFAELGYVVIRDAFTAEEAARLLAGALDASHMTLDDYEGVVAGNLPSYHCHGSLARTPSLWWVLIHPGLVRAVTLAVGTDCCCLPGIDTLAAHYSEIEPHRDTSPAELPSLRPGGGGEYGVIRAILYPSPGESQFGVVGRSHHLTGSVDEVLSSPDVIWDWLDLSDRDVVLFDPRVVHAGGPLRRARVMMVLTYGRRTVGSVETYFHARIRTPTLNFPDPSPALADKLRASGLFPEQVVDRRAWERYRTVWEPRRPST